MIYPSIRQLQFLLALDQHRNFSHAAAHVHVSQPALSTGIKELEKAIGQPLIERGAKTVTFTQIGVETLALAKRVLNDIQGHIELCEQLGKPMHGTVRLGVIPTIAPYLLPAVKKAINERYPALRIQLFEYTSDILVEQLEQGHIDLGLMAFPYDTRNLWQSPLFKEKFWLATPRDFEMMDSYPHLSPDAPAPHKILLLEEGHCLTDHTIDACQIQPSRSRKAYSASSLMTLLEMVKSGFGVTYVPNMLVKTIARDPDLRFHDLPWPEPTREIGLIWRPHTPRAADYIKIGKEICKAAGAKIPEYLN